MRNRTLSQIAGLLVMGISLLSGGSSPAAAQWLHTMQAWGGNGAGQLGSGSSVAYSASPVSVSGLAGITAVSAGDWHSLALKQDGTVWAWGYNVSGELGDGLYTNSSVPVSVIGVANVSAIAAGSGHSMALTRDGRVWTWGDNSLEELGDGGTELDSPTPVPVVGLTGATAIAAGADHCLALMPGGVVMAWGYNNDGELGNGTDASSNTPVPVSNLTGVVAIAAGFAHSLALMQDGTVMAWGYNEDGELGNNTRTESYVPVPVNGLTGVVAVAAGYWHSIAVKQDGTVWTWGDNFYGELGTGTNVWSAVPVQVSGLAGVTAAAGGQYYSVALRSDGTVWTWGWNADGQLGNGTNTDGYLPTQAPSLHGVSAVAAGEYHSLALQPGEPFDLTGSGNTGLLWRDAVTGQLNYYLMSSGRMISYGTITSSVPGAWHVVAQPDIDGDGIPDIVWQNTSTGDVTYWLMNGIAFTGTWGYVARATPSGWNVVAAADMDGDGSPDLIWQNAQNGDVTYLQVENGQWTGTWGYLSQGVPPQWHVVGAVDLFGDGNNDLIWWNSESGDVTYWRMNRTSYTGTWGYITSGVPTNWHVVGLADFNGDGLPDIVWQDTYTSDVTYYEVINQKWTGNWAYLSQGVPTEWTLTGLR